MVARPVVCVRNTFIDFVREPVAEDLKRSQSEFCSQADVAAAERVWMPIAPPIMLPHSQSDTGSVEPVPVGVDVSDDDDDDAAEALPRSRTHLRRDVQTVEHSSCRSPAAPLAEDPHPHCVVPDAESWFVGDAGEEGDCEADGSDEGEAEDGGAEPASQVISIKNTFISVAEAPPAASLLQRAHSDMPRPSGAWDVEPGLVLRAGGRPDAEDSPPVPTLDRTPTIDGYEPLAVGTHEPWMSFDESPIGYDAGTVGNMAPAYRGNLLALAWLDEMLRNSMWVPLSAYAKGIDLNAATLGAIFAVNVGTRFIPNLLVTQFGSKTEIPMMVAVSTGYLAAFCWPNAVWALYTLAVTGGCGFVRGCVTLHAQALCKADVDALSEASRLCGVARTCADVCSFMLPAAVYDVFGWSGFTLLGAALPVVYVLLALPIHRHTAQAGATHGGCGEALVEVAADALGQRSGVRWIDWVLAAAFVSTELQWNLLNTAVPAALVHRYELPASLVGLVIAIGCLVALGYLLALPSLPRFFNKHRPLNLLITYTGMSASWVLMISCVVCGLPAPLFVIGGYMFLAMANASQVVLLECLTGVCDLETSTKVMGISEMLGCAFGMLGSYCGEALLVLGMSAPFLAVGHFSLLSTGLLAACLGQRRSEIERNTPCALAVAGDFPAGGKNDDTWVHALHGLRSIIYRQDSFIGAELSYRGGLKLGETDVSTPRIGADGEIDVLDRSPLLSPIRLNSGLRCLSDLSVASCRSASGRGLSTAEARRVKRLTAAFQHSHVELDSDDHEDIGDLGQMSSLLRLTSLDNVGEQQPKRLELADAM